MLQLPPSLHHLLLTWYIRIRRLLHWMMYPLRRINAADIYLIHFLHLWFGSRGWRNMALGLPAVIIFATAAIVLSARQTLSNSELALHYREIADEALAAGDDQTAGLWMRKVAVLAPKDPDILYNQALVAADHGDRDTARTIMKQLADDESTPSRTGQPELWLAMDLVQNEGTIPAEQVDDFHSYLTAAVERHPNNIEVREMLVRLELSRNHPEDAIVHLRHLTELEPRFALLLAQSLTAVGLEDRAGAAAQAASHRYAELLRSDPSDIDAEIERARLEAFLERYALATGLLQRRLIDVARQEQQLLESPPDDEEAAATEAGQLAKLKERIRLELSAILVQWSNYVHLHFPDNFGRRLELLQEALDLSPHDPRVLEAVAMLAVQQNEPTAGLRDRLNDVLALGQATPITHLILSMGALSRGDRTTEEHHLRLALASNPNMPIAANNLAMLLSERDPPETEEALELVNHALKLDPNHPEIRATRGAIYARAGRTYDAIIDLEFALTHLEGRPDLHTELCQLYEEIGDEELAGRHRKLAVKATGSLSTVTHQDLRKQQRPVGTARQ